MTKQDFLWHLFFKLKHVNTNQTSLWKERSICFLSPCLSTSPSTSRKVQSQRLYLYCSTGTVWSLKPNSPVTPHLHTLGQLLGWPSRSDAGLSEHPETQHPLKEKLSHLPDAVPIHLCALAEKHLKQAYKVAQHSSWAKLMLGGEGRMGSVGSFHEINGCMTWDLMSP